MLYSKEIKSLLDMFNKLPGVGPKTAERFVFWILKQPGEFVKEFADALQAINTTTKTCAVCFTLSSVTPCVICKDPKRDATTLCVIEDTADLYAIETSGEYRGRYHVLGGLVTPLEGVTPEKLNVRQLLDRVKNSVVKEVILALNPTIEGETTLLYLTKILKNAGVSRVTTLGRGLPYGADLEYADSLTLSHALLGRRELKQ